MGKTNKWPDEKIIQAAKDGGAVREKAVNHILNEYIQFLPAISQKTGVTKEEGLDAFTDAIIDLLDQVSNAAFKGQSKLSTYFYKIFYFKCVDLLRKKTTNKIDYQTELPEVQDTSSLISADLEIAEELNQLQSYMDILGEPCRQILMDWGFWGYNMNEIATRAGLKGSTQAKDKKYKCIMKLRALMKRS